MAERPGIEPGEPKPVHRLAICCITALPPLRVGVFLYICTEAKSTDFKKVWLSFLVVFDNYV